MTLEFAQSSHDATDTNFAEKLELINKIAAFQPSSLQRRIMSRFLSGQHRLTFLTSSLADRMGLRNSVAAGALDELCDMGYMGFYPSAHKYGLLKKGRDYMVFIDLPPVTGTMTPPRTYVNATTGSIYSLQKLNLRDGWDHHLMIKSLPMGKQLQMIAS